MSKTRKDNFHDLESRLKKNIMSKNQDSIFIQ